MILNFDVTDSPEKKALVFDNIKKLDRFFDKNFVGLSPVLSTLRVDSAADYEKKFLSCSSDRQSESNRIKSAVGLMRKIKLFNENNDFPLQKVSANELSDIHDAINRQEFINDTGVSVEVLHDGGNAGFIRANVFAINGEPKEIKLPFVILWNTETFSDNEDNEVDIDVGQLRILDRSQRFTSFANALSEFKFTKEPNIGLMADTGFSINDLKDKDVLMKTKIIDFSDVMELSSFASRHIYKAPPVEHKMAASM